MNAANRIEYSGNSTDTGFFTALRITIMSFSIFFANFLIIFFLIFPVCRAEKLILEEVQKKAVDSSPLKKQLLYYQTMSALEQSNLNSNYLPQLSLDGQATYQSDVFKLPFTLPQGFPSINIPEVRKDQYKVSLGINQMIYDGGIVSGMKDSKSLEYETSARTVDINLFKINLIINQLFFSALIL